VIDGYRVGAEDLDADLIHRWLSVDAYWAAGRTREVVERSIAGSLCLGAFTSDGSQVAFARAVTDSATFAWIADVYVDRAHRGRGLGRWLVGELRDRLESVGCTGCCWPPPMPTACTRSSVSRRWTARSGSWRSIDGDRRH
jgi:GNAT superfamily N-acetyltransferase